MLPLHNPSRPWFRRIGCLGWLGLIVLVLVATYGVTALISPWSVHIGGQPTPLMRWDGYGEGITPAGTPVVIALSLGTPIARGVPSGRGDLAGSGELCTPAADIHFRSLGGRMHAWWSTEGSTMTVQLYRASSVPSWFEIDLQGSWHGDTYTATDQSELFEHLDAGGQFHASYTALPSPRVTALQIHGGNRDAFRAACRRIRTS